MLEFDERLSDPVPGTFAPLSGPLSLNLLNILPEI